MKKVFLLYLLATLFTRISAEIAIPQVASSVVITCGTNNYSITGTPGIGGTDIEWFSDNGTSTVFTILLCKSKNGVNFIKLKQ